MRIRIFGFWRPRSEKMKRSIKIICLMLVLALSVCFASCGAEEQDVSLYESNENIAALANYLYGTKVEGAIDSAEVMTVLARAGVDLGDYAAIYADSLKGEIKDLGSEITYGKLVYSVQALVALGAEIDSTVVAKFNDSSFTVGDAPNIYQLYYELQAANAMKSAGINVNTDAMVAAIVELKLDNDSFGWSNDDANLDIDATAGAINALMPYYSESGVKAVVDACLTKLAGIVNENGSFTSYGSESICSTAQVVLALVQADCYGVETTLDAKKCVEYLESKIQDDGTFDATGAAYFNSVQGAEALVSYYLNEGGKGTLYGKAIEKTK